MFCQKKVLFAMLYKVSELIDLWNLPIGEVLHIGAHEAEEDLSYKTCNFGPVTWVEAQPHLAEKLIQKLDVSRNRVLSVAAWDANNIDLKLKITSNSQSSSFLNMGTHLKMYPEITVDSEIALKSARLDSILPPNSEFTLINLDIQGAELHALRGLGEILSKSNIVYSEVNRKFLYKNCAQVSEIDTYLKEFGYKRVSTRWHVRAGWGDAVYRKITLRRRSFNQYLTCSKNQALFYLPQMVSLVRKIFNFLVGKGK